MHFALDKTKNCIPPNCTSIELKDASKLIFLCTFLQSNNTVKEVNLGESKIGDKGAKAIAKALKVNQTITRVHLYNNQIADQGAKAIAKALKVNCTVTELYLFDNEIKDEGAKAIAEALKVNRTIDILHLSGNRIRDEGAKAIAKALKVNRTVTSLGLWGSTIREKGAKAIAEALKANCTVTKLYLHCYSIGDEGVLAILEALKLNCTVVELGFWGISKAEIQINISIEKELKKAVAETQCKTMALGLFRNVPIYLLLDIHELVVISDMERKTNSYKFYNNRLFLKLLESKVSKKRLLRMIDKVNQILCTKIKFLL